MRFLNRPSPRRIKTIVISMGLLVFTWGAFLWITSPIGVRAWIAVTGYRGCRCGDCLGGWLENSNVILPPFDSWADRTTVAYLALAYAAALTLTAIFTPLASRITTIGLARPRSNTCRECGYSMAGLPDAAPCPECGRLAQYADQRAR